MPELEAGYLVSARYRVEKALGSGGSGSVYLAYDQQLGRHVALKVLDRLWSAESTDFSGHRFRREAQVLSSLEHSNIIKVYRFGELEDAAPYLVMEYIEGESLRDYLSKTKRLPLNEALQIAKQLCAALEYAHKAGVVHRDLKPENVMITLSESESAGPLLSIKVLDFGLCKMEKTDEKSQKKYVETVDLSGTENMALTTTGLIIGTASYMSPEQCLGEATDYRTDIYSLACMIFELISGRAPFLAETPAAVMLAHLSEPFPRLSFLSPASDFPPELDSLLQRSSSKNKSDRYQSIEELQEHLDHLIHIKSAAVFDNSLKGPLTNKRKKLLLFSALALLLLPLIAVYFYLESDSGKVIMAVQAESSLPAANAINLLAQTHKDFLNREKKDKAAELVDSSCNSRVFQLWPRRARSELFENYIENYIDTKDEDSAFKLTVRYLGNLLDSVRWAQKLYDKAGPPESETRDLSCLCQKLFESEHSKGQWAQISETIEVRGSLFTYQSPGFILWPAALRARARYKSSLLNNEERAKEISHNYDLACVFARAAMNEKLLLTLADEGINAGGKFELRADRLAMLESICEFYVNKKDMDRAKESLRKVEAALKGIEHTLSNADTERLYNLRIACGVGEVLPLPESDKRYKGIVTRMLLRGSK